MTRRELIFLLAAVLTLLRALRAQQKVMPVVGYLNGTTPEANALGLAAFLQGLSETGWVEGQNLNIFITTGYPRWPPISWAKRST